MQESELREKFGCAVTSMSYSFEHRTGNVHMVAGHTTDMSSTIDFFKKLDPDVVHIVTWSGDEVATSYVNDNGWIAI